MIVSVGGMAVVRVEVIVIVVDDGARTRRYDFIFVRVTMIHHHCRSPRKVVHDYY
jgi:hypothetical protein